MNGRVAAVGLLGLTAAVATATTPMPSPATVPVTAPPPVPVPVRLTAGVHDPCVVRDGRRYYLFGTGRGGSAFTSDDLFAWRPGPPVLASVPDWTRAYNPAGEGIWAPDVSFADGKWNLYYAVSRFGRTRSAIGLATSPTLDPARPDYKWADAGPVVATADGDDWNAIDPCAVTDADGRRWLVCGSCWTGLKLFRLDPATGLLADPKARPVPLAAHPPANLIEEGYVRRHGDHYYLWVSVGHCCRGADSDYSLLVGRSRTIDGPYVDRDGRPMTRGGGTLVLAGEGEARGPGSSATVDDGRGRDFLVHHYYDAARHGRPTLGVRRLVWDADGWPLVGEPLTGPPGAPAPSRSPAGTWTVTTEFRNPTPVTLADDAWEADHAAITVRLPASAEPVRCAYAEDGTWFAGRDRAGRQVRGRRATP